jgi:hypothetical protein
MTTRRTALLLVALSLFGAACGRLNDAGGNGDGTAAGIPHPVGPDDLIVRWEFVGGFTSPEITLTRIPAFSLYGDGKLVTEGPQTEIYPGPALPNLLVQRISEDGVQAILAAARDAGLTNGDASYPNPCVADAPDTRFTVVADGRTSVVTAGALGIGGGGCQASDPQATKRLSAFLEQLGTLPSWLPAGSVGSEQSFTPTGLAIYVHNYTPDPQLQESPVAWPGSALARAGDAVDAVPDLRCAVVDGTDVPTVLKAASSANQLTPWTSNGRDFGIIFRPLLPDEPGC